VPSSIGQKPLPSRESFDPFPWSDAERAASFWHAAALHAAGAGALETAADRVDERVSVLLEPGIVSLRSLVAASLAPVVDPTVVAGGDLTPDVGERLLSLGEDEVDQLRCAVGLDAVGAGEPAEPGDPVEVARVVAP
jgi:hypothetical protein